jgi:hypothetical protein
LGPLNTKEAMNRTYEIHKTETGWQLFVWEDGKQLAKKVAGNTEEGYAYLLDQAENTYGIKKKTVKATWWRP